MDKQALLRIVSELSSRLKANTVKFDRMSKDNLIDYIQDTGILKVFLKSLGEQAAKKKIRSFLVAKSLGKEDLPPTIGTLKRMTSGKLKAWLKSVFKRLELPKNFEKMRAKSLAAYVKKHGLASSLGMDKKPEVVKQPKAAISQPKQKIPPQFAQKKPIPVMRGSGGSRYFGKTAQQAQSERNQSMVNERTMLELELFRRKMKEDVENLVKTQKERFNILEQGLKKELAATEDAIVKSQLSKKQTEQNLRQLDELDKVREALKDQRIQFEKEMQKLRMETQQESKQEEAEVQKFTVTENKRRREILKTDLENKLRNEFDEMIRNRMVDGFKSERLLMEEKIKTEILRETESIRKEALKEKQLSESALAKVEKLVSESKVRQTGLQNSIEETQKRVELNDAARLESEKNRSTLASLQSKTDQYENEIKNRKIDVEKKMINLRDEVAKTFVNLQASQIKNESARQDLLKKAAEIGSDVLDKQFSSEITGGVQEFINRLRPDFERTMDVDEGGQKAYTFMDADGIERTLANQSLKDEIIKHEAEFIRDKYKLKAAQQRRLLEEETSQVKFSDTTKDLLARVQKLETDFRLGASDLEALGEEMPPQQREEKPEPTRMEIDSLQPNPWANDPFTNKPERTSFEASIAGIDAFSNVREHEQTDWESKMKETGMEETAEQFEESTQELVKDLGGSKLSERQLQMIREQMQQNEIKLRKDKEINIVLQQELEQLRAVKPIEFDVSKQLPQEKIDKWRGTLMNNRAKILQAGKAYEELKILKSTLEQPITKSTEALDNFNKILIGIGIVSRGLESSRMLDGMIEIIKALPEGAKQKFSDILQRYPRFKIQEHEMVNLKEIVDKRAKELNEQISGDVQEWLRIRKELDFRNQYERELRLVEEEIKHNIPGAQMRKQNILERMRKYPTRDKASLAFLQGEAERMQLQHEGSEKWAEIRQKYYREASDYETDLQTRESKIPKPQPTDDEKTDQKTDDAGVEKPSIGQLEEARKPQPEMINYPLGEKDNPTYEDSIGWRRNYQRELLRRAIDGKITAAWLHETLQQNPKLKNEIQYVIDQLANETIRLAYPKHVADPQSLVYREVPRTMEAIHSWIDMWKQSIQGVPDSEENRRRITNFIKQYPDDIKRMWLTQVAPLLGTRLQPPGSTGQAQTPTENEPMDTSGQSNQVDDEKVADTTQNDLEKLKTEKGFKSVGDKLQAIMPWVRDGSIGEKMKTPVAKETLASIEHEIIEAANNWSKKDRRNRFILGFGDRHDIGKMLEYIQTSKLAEWGELQESTTRSIAALTDKLVKYSTPISVTPYAITQSDVLENINKTDAGIALLEKIESMESFYDGDADRLPPWVPDEIKLISDALDVSNEINDARISQSPLPINKLHKVYSQMLKTFPGIERSQHKYYKLFRPLDLIGQSISSIQTGTKRKDFQNSPSKSQKKKRVKVAGSMVIMKLPKKLNPDLLPEKALQSRVSNLNIVAATRYKKQLVREMKRTGREDLQKIIKFVEKHISGLADKKKRRIKSKLSKLF